MPKTYPTNLNNWPIEGRVKPGPPVKYPRQFKTLRLTEDQDDHLEALSIDLGIHKSEVLRRSLEQMYKQHFDSYREKYLTSNQG